MSSLLPSDAANDALVEAEAALRVAKTELAIALSDREGARHDSLQLKKGLLAAMEQLTLIQQAYESKVLRKPAARSIIGRDRERRAAAESLIKRNKEVLTHLTAQLAGIDDDSTGGAANWADYHDNNDDATHASVDGGGGGLNLPSGLHRLIFSDVSIKTMGSAPSSSAMMSADSVGIGVGFGYGDQQPTGSVGGGGDGEEEEVEGEESEYEDEGDDDITDGAAASGARSHTASTGGFPFASLASFWWPGQGQTAAAASGGEQQRRGKAGRSESIASDGIAAAAAASGASGTSAVADGSSSESLAPGTLIASSSEPQQQQQLPPPRARTGTSSSGYGLPPLQPPSSVTVTTYQQATGVDSTAPPSALNSARTGRASSSSMPATALSAATSSSCSTSGLRSLVTRIDTVAAQAALQRAADSGATLPLPVTLVARSHALTKALRNAAAALKPASVSSPQLHPLPLGHVFSFLSHRDLALASTVCRSWRAIPLRSDSRVYRLLARSAAIPSSLRGAVWASLGASASSMEGYEGDVEWSEQQLRHAVASLAQQHSAAELSSAADGDAASVHGPVPMQSTPNAEASASSHSSSSAPSAGGGSLDLSPSPRLQPYYLSRSRQPSASSIDVGASPGSAAADDAINDLYSPLLSSASTRNSEAAFQPEQGGLAADVTAAAAAASSSSKFSVTGNSLTIAAAHADDPLLPTTLWKMFEQSSQSDAVVCASPRQPAARARGRPSVDSSIRLPCLPAPIRLQIALPPDVAATAAPLLGQDGAPFCVKSLLSFVSEAAGSGETSSAQRAALGVVMSGPSTGSGAARPTHFGRYLRAAVSNAIASIAVSELRSAAASLRQCRTTSRDLLRIIHAAADAGEAVAPETSEGYAAATDALQQAEKRVVASHAAALTSVAQAWADLETADAAVIGDVIDARRLRLKEVATAWAAGSGSSSSNSSCLVHPATGKMIPTAGLRLPPATSLPPTCIAADDASDAPAESSAPAAGSNPSSSSSSSSSLASAWPPLLSPFRPLPPHLRERLKRTCLGADAADGATAAAAAAAATSSSPSSSPAVSYDEAYSDAVTSATRTLQVHLATAAGTATASCPSAPSSALSSLLPPPLLLDLGPPATATSDDAVAAMAAEAAAVATVSSVVMPVSEEALSSAIALCLPPLPFPSQHVLIEADVRRSFGDIERALLTSQLLVQVRQHSPQKERKEGDEEGAGANRAATSSAALFPTSLVVDGSGDTGPFSVSHHSLALLRARLAACLLAFGAFDRHTGYVQGINFIASLALRHMYPAQCLTLLGSLLHCPKYALADVFSHGLTGLEARFAQLSGLLALHAPRLASHLTRLEIAPSSYATGWLMTLFTSGETLPAHYTAPLFGSFLLDGWKAVMRAAVVLLMQLEPDLMRADFANAVQYLHTIPEHRLPPSPAAFMRRAARVKVTERLLALLTPPPPVLEAPQQRQKQPQSEEPTRAGDGTLTSRSAAAPSSTSAAASSSSASFVAASPPLLATTRSMRIDSDASVDFSLYAPPGNSSSNINGSAALTAPPSRTSSPRPDSFSLSASVSQLFGRGASNTASAVDASASSAAGAAYIYSISSRAHSPRPTVVTHLAQPLMTSAASGGGGGEETDVVAAAVTSPGEGDAERSPHRTHGTPVAAAADEDSGDGTSRSPHSEKAARLHRLSQTVLTQRLDFAAFVAAVGADDEKQPQISETFEGNSDALAALPSEGSNQSAASLLGGPLDRGISASIARSPGVPLDGAEVPFSSLSTPSPDDALIAAPFKHLTMDDAVGSSGHTDQQCSSADAYGAPNNIPPPLVSPAPASGGSLSASIGTSPAAAATASLAAGSNDFGSFDAEFPPQQ